MRSLLAPEDAQPGRSETTEERAQDGEKRRRAYPTIAVLLPAVGLRASGSASMGEVKATDLWRHGQRGWPPQFPVAQFPNPPLLLAFVGWGLAAASDGTPHEIGRVAFRVGLVVWAYGEMMRGVNWFRRLLGAGVLVWTLADLAGEP
jgi:hypothetical protein